jgi:hypothetical protein
MIKKKQAIHLKIKKDIAQINEIMCKCLIHNICVLNQYMFQLSIEVNFQEEMVQDYMCKAFNLQ